MIFASNEVYMKLMTDEIAKELNQLGLNGQESKGMDSRVIVKYFNPYGKGTWLITGGEKQDDGDWLLFGFVSLLYNEWGYVLLSELESLEISGYGKIIQRDLYLDKNTTVRLELLKYGINES